MKITFTKMLAPAAALAVAFSLGACSTSDESVSAKEPSAQAANEAQADGTEEITLYVTRHGKTMLNTTDRVQGWADSPLTEPGVEVTEDLGPGLDAEGIRFDAVYSSDSGRAIETANLVLNQVGQAESINLQQLEDLREWNFGTFEGDYNDNMLEAVTKQTNYQGDEDVRVGLGIEALANAVAAADETGIAEDGTQTEERTRRAMDTITQTSVANGDSTVLVTAHGLTINALLHMIDPNISTVQIPNAAVAKIVYRDGDYTIESMNDESFIEKGTALRS